MALRVFHILESGVLTWLHTVPGEVPYFLTLYGAPSSLCSLAEGSALCMF